MARKWIKNVSLNGQICDIAVKTENSRLSAEQTPTVWILAEIKYIPV